MSEDGMPQPIEFFVASDASAVIEHTKRVLYLEDDDIAHIAEGGESSAGFVPSVTDAQSSTSTDFDETTVSHLSEPSSISKSSSPRS
jgi:glucosamine 6-phosphate synthetase-like amidotransferase/phosphosugar isomerase protein